MYYVVTGAAGFIGSRLVAALNRRGIADIIAVDNLPAGGELRNLTGMRIRDYLRHDEFLERFDGALEAVFHEGACTNTMVHDRCLSARVPLIYASSAAVYGGSGEFREEPQCERPLNVYGESKLLFDQEVRRRLPQAGGGRAGGGDFYIFWPDGGGRGGRGA